MTRLKWFLLMAVMAVVSQLSTQAAEPLRVFIRGGVKTHGPGQHDHPRFLGEWTKLLNERGAKVDGGMDFPTAEQLEKADVLVMFAADAGKIKPDQREYLDKFLKRGGGMVCIHDAVCGNDAQWFKTIIGGAWEHGYSKWYEGEMSFYYMDTDHPITQGVSNFELDDELYYDLHMMPEAKILAATYTPYRSNKGRDGGTPPSGKPSVYDLQPQMWTYETGNHRAFVSLLGHNYKTFNLPHVRAVMLRGIAWAGKRANVDEFCTKDELASLRYPEGGPTAPEKAAAKLEVHPEFNIQLVAAEPLINKPMNIDWDPAGRLWVAETPEYPNGRREPRKEMQPYPWKDTGFRVRPPTTNRPAIDRISILTDTDGDGRMDKKDIFYEGLELVTSFVFYKDGVIVSQAPDILWLRDVNGDGKAEKVEKLYTGLGIGDTHAVINNLRWSLDGWIYATHGYSSSAHVYNGDKSKDFGGIGSGVLRFKADGSMIEMVSSKGGNTWGMETTSDGELFYTQPTSGDLLNHVVSFESDLARGKVGNATSFKPVIRGQKSFPLITYNQQAYVQIDLVGYFTAAAGCAIYDGSAWPAEWNYNYFTTEPTINIVHHQVVEPNGVTYKAHKTREAEFIGGRDKWFRPIDTRIGPDGALYITDFYNQAVVHNDTRGTIHGPANAALRPDRDHYFGRIWRVNHKQAKTLKVPNIAKANTKELVEAIQNPNRHVRLNAQRLLVEKNDSKTPDAMKRLLSSWNFRGLEEPQAHALWALHQMGRLDAKMLTTALSVDGKPAVQKAAVRIAAETPAQKRNDVMAGILKRVNDSNPRVRLQAINALASLPSTPEIRQALVEAYPNLDDVWLQSAVVGVASKAPVEFIEAAASAKKPADLESLVAQLSTQLAGKQDAALAGKLVVALASKPSNADVLKKVAIENLAKTLKADVVPSWSADLQKSLKTLLTSPNPALPAAVLPLVARWDKDGKLASDTKALVASLSDKLKDEKQSDDTRAQIAASLVGVRQMNADILPSVAGLLGSSASPSLQKRVIESLGASGDAAVAPLLAGAFAKIPAELQDSAFAQIVKRADWSMALVESIKSGKVTLANLGPSSVHRLRTHSDKDVAKRAGEVIDELRGPEVKEKNALIAKLTPEVEKPGNVENGKKLFAANCAVCHRFNGEGKEIGPELTGMGAHGPAELLVAILDPNREVDPSFLSWSIETKDGETLDGLIASENRSGVTLRNNSGETVVKTADIKGRRNTGRSLMPEGFESLGGESLRDILAYMCGSDARYRIVDLRSAFTANSTEGIYVSRESKGESVHFRKFGIVKAGEVPFEVIHPSKSSSGNNVVVLKGGQGYSKTLPQKVETGTLNVKATRLHFLGGVAGWGYPCCGENKNEGTPVVKATVDFVEGPSEEFIFKNGVEYADYNGEFKVPGSKLVEGVVRDGQIRTFSRALKNKSAMKKITLESFNNGVAPTIVAITADTTEAGASADPADTSAREVKSGETAAAAAPVALPTFKWGSGIKTLMVGGGSSHDFSRWFDKYDRETLSEGGLASVNYTDKPAAIAGALKYVDVLYQSANQKMDDKELRKAIFDFAEAGKGIVFVHAGVWYNWSDWQEYNRVLVGGGSRGHDRFGEFEVNLDVKDHPVMKGVDATFKITDELYYQKFETNGTPVQVLATAKNLASGKTYPSVWIVKHPKARIVCIALGHDGLSHGHPAYKTMLRNAVTWAAGK